MKQPLRRVVRFSTEGPLTFEVLECGHTRTPKTNSFSKYDDLGHATRRRCWKCAKGKPVELGASPGAEPPA
jgi:hypothetical protein